MSLSTSAEYRTWTHMKTRCYNLRSSSYRWYGARGIKVCDRWRSSFIAFLSDMGPRPSPTHSIERIDNDGDYCPENCRWATKREQVANTRATHRVVLDGQQSCLAHVAEVAGVAPCTIRQRMKHMSAEKAVALGRNRRKTRPGERTRYKAGTSTGYKGVYKNNNRYEARIRSGSKVEYIGLFRTAEDAARAYNQRASDLWGSLAKLNTMPIGKD